MKPAIRFFTFLCFVFLFSTCLFAQAPGDLDTSFHIRTNYGALFPIEKAWPLADGSIICYTEGGNFFSGKRTGNFLKIKPNGEFDTDYTSPPFSINFECGFCSCYPGEPRISITNDGIAYLLTNFGISVNGHSFQKSFLRFGTTGQIDTSLVQANAFSPNGIYPLHSQGLLRYYDNRILYYSNQFEEDSTRGNFHFEQGEFLNQSGPFSNDSITTFPIDSADERFCINYNHNTFSFSAKKKREKLKDILPITVGIDSESRIYEFFYNCDTVGGIVFHRIVRRNLNADLDSVYRTQVQSSDFQFSNFLFDKAGFLTFPASDKQARIRFDKTTGNILDTVNIDRSLWVRTGNTIVQIGTTTGNRWAFELQTPSGDVLAHKETRFGPNGSILKVQSDQEGRALISGDFTEVDGIQYPWLARIGKNGFVDTSFHMNTFLPGDSGKTVLFDLNKTTGQILLIRSKSSGTKNRFAYRIFSDGTIDSNFAATNLSGFPHPVKEIQAGNILESGSILLVVRFNDPDDPMNSYFIKLNPNGEKDQQFQIKSRTEFLPEYAGCSTTFNRIRILRPNLIQFELTGFCTGGGDDPPCKSVSHPQIHETSIGIQFDTTGTELVGQPFQFALGTILQIPNFNTGKSTLFLSGQPVTPPYSSSVYLINDDNSLDSNFRTRNPDGSQIINYPRPLTGIHGGDYLFATDVEYQNLQTTIYDYDGIYFIPVMQTSLMKLNENGILDTSFHQNLFYSGISSIAQPDSSHLYIAGGFRVRNYEVVPPLVRIHNARSNVTANAQTRLAQSTIRVFPNPIRETLFLSGWKPGTELMLTNVQGKVLFHETVTESIRTESLRLLPGIYFWKATRNGSMQGFGKLVKE